MDICTYIARLVYGLWFGVLVLGSCDSSMGCDSKDMQAEESKSIEDIEPFEVLPNSVNNSTTPSVNQTTVSTSEIDTDSMESKQKTIVLLDVRLVPSSQPLQKPGDNRNSRNRDQIIVNAPPQVSERNKGIRKLIPDNHFDDDRDSESSSPVENTSNKQTYTKENSVESYKVSNAVSEDESRTNQPRGKFKFRRPQFRPTFVHPPPFFRFSPYRMETVQFESSRENNFPVDTNVASNIGLHLDLRVLDPQKIVQSPPEARRYFHKSIQTRLPNPDFYYTVMNRIPHTNFNCKAQLQPGFYADVQAGCRVFHTCDKDMRKHTFRCPVGTAFNQQTMVCDWWYNVNCNDATFYYRRTNIYH